MIKTYEGFKFRQLDNFCCELEMDDNVMTYDIVKTDENEYQVIVTYNN